MLKKVHRYCAVYICSAGLDYGMEGEEALIVVREVRILNVRI